MSRAGRPALEMQGLIADVNVQGHLNRLRDLRESMDLWIFIEDAGLRFATFAEVHLPTNLDDRSLWTFCRDEGRVLFTNDRNSRGPNSLQATLDDSWAMGDLPVLTLGNLGRFARDGSYARRVASDAADLLMDLKSGGERARPRIYVPLRWSDLPD